MKNVWGLLVQDFYLFIFIALIVTQPPTLSKYWRETVYWTLINPHLLWITAVTLIKCWILRSVSITRLSESLCSTTGTHDSAVVCPTPWIVHTTGWGSWDFTPFGCSMLNAVRWLQKLMCVRTSRNFTHTHTHVHVQVYMPTHSYTISATCTLNTLQVIIHVFLPTYYHPLLKLKKNMTFSDSVFL